tara:strand:- start:568 stop:891 length:324 start_codon:yes stop_codon:yes gene_type:complete
MTSLENYTDSTWLEIWEGQRDDKKHKNWLVKKAKERNEEFQRRFRVAAEAKFPSLEGEDDNVMSDSTNSGGRRRDSANTYNQMGEGKKMKKKTRRKRKRKKKTRRQR